MSRQQVFAPRRRATLRASSAVPPLILLGMGLAAASCGTENYYETQYVFPARGDAGAPSTPPEQEPGDAGLPPAPDGGETPPDDGLPTIDTEPDALEVDVLGRAGNRYYFLVSDEQLERMNQPYGGGGPFPEPGPVNNDDLYTPGGGVVVGGVTFVDHLLVTTAGESPKTADFGKVQVKLVGQSTGRAWTTTSLPNFKIDSDEFLEGNRIGGVKHMRLNNAVIGSIFREKLTLDLYAKLGYPAPRANYAWVQSSVWGPEISVPYVVVESYKPAFCKQREAELNGGCVNMWEFASDLGFGGLAAPENCQFSECDPGRALDFEVAAVAAEQGPGFKEALSEWLDWDAFHRFQCLSWILATGDDALHNSNNFVLMERADGKFQHLPYSVDISLGQDWYPRVELAGSSLLAQGCQNDPVCWDDLIATCELMVDGFVAANPISMLDQTYALLAQQGMLRAGDEERYQALSSYLARRIEELPVELEEYREGPPPTYCPAPLIRCGDGCVRFEEECLTCEPEPQPEPLPDAGVDLQRGAADIALPGPGDVPGPGVPPPGEPNVCRPPIDDYEPLPLPRPR